MNNDLEQFSEEKLKAWISDDPNKTYHIDGEDLQYLARIALAAKQAKPVAEVYQPANVGICAPLGPSIRMINISPPVGTKLYTTPPAPQLPVEKVIISLDMLHDYRDVKNAEVEHARVLAGDRGEGSRWDRNFRELKAELEAIDEAIAAAPNPDHSGEATEKVAAVSPINVDNIGWIKCSDRMPQHYGYYLTWDGRYIVVASMLFGRFIQATASQGEVTHWMPISAVPKPDGD